MIIVNLLSILLSSLSAQASSDIEAVIKASQAATAQGHEAAKEVLGELRSGKGCGEPTNGCRNTFIAAAETKDTSDTQLLIFVSSSMPQDSLRSLYSEAHKIGAKLVFRGLIDNSFKQTQSYFRQTEIIAEIDPTKFEDFDIVECPTFILTSEKSGKHDRLIGHVSVLEALDQFRDKGELKSEAKALISQLKGSRP